MSPTMLPPQAPAPYPLPVAIPSGASNHAALGGFSIDWNIDGLHAGQRFSVVHHPLAPRALAAPLHRHHREDEYSYVLTGTLGALLGEDIITAAPGTWVFKPRGQWHTFWNAGDIPCEIVEIISPAGFENYFRELAALWPGKPPPELLRKYELDVNPGSIQDLCARFALTSGRG